MIPSRSSRVWLQPTYGNAEELGLSEDDVCAHISSMLRAYEMYIANRFGHWFRLPWAWALLCHSVYGRDVAKQLVELVNSGRLARSGVLAAKIDYAGVLADDALWAAVVAFAAGTDPLDAAAHTQCLKNYCKRDSPRAARRDQPWPAFTTRTQHTTRATRTRRRRATAGPRTTSTTHRPSGPASTAWEWDHFNQRRARRNPPTHTVAAAQVVTAITNVFDHIPIHSAMAEVGVKTCRGADLNTLLNDHGLGTVIRRMNSEFDLSGLVANEASIAGARHALVEAEAERRQQTLERATKARDQFRDAWSELFDGDDDVADVYSDLARDSAAYAQGLASAASARSDQAHARRHGIAAAPAPAAADVEEAAAGAPSVSARAASNAAVFAASPFAILEPLVPYLVHILKIITMDRCIDPADIAKYLSYLVAKLPSVAAIPAAKAKCPFCTNAWTSVKGATELRANHIHTRHILPMQATAGSYFEGLVGGLGAYALPTQVADVADYRSACAAGAPNPASYRPSIRRSTHKYLDRYIVPLLRPALRNVFETVRAAPASDAPLNLTELLQKALPEAAPAERPDTEPYEDILEDDVLGLERPRPEVESLTSLESLVPGIIVSALVAAADPNPQPLPGEGEQDEIRLSYNAAVKDDSAKVHHFMLTLIPTLADRSS